LPTNRLRPIAATAVVGVVAVALVGACTSSVPGTPTAAEDHPSIASPGSTPSAGPGSGVVVVRGYEDVIAANAASRAIDPCALHDIAAAEQVTGMKGQLLMPGTLNLASCDLEVGPPEDALDAWRMTASAGVPLNDETVKKATPEQINNTSVLHVPDVIRSDDSCTYMMDNSPQVTTGTPPRSTSAGGQNAGQPVRTALELTVRREDTKQTASPCQVAKDYLTAVIKYWIHPAHRADQLTTPALPIGQADPCAGLVGVAPAMGGGIQVKPSRSNPYECSALPAKVSPGTNPALVTVDFTFKSDPREALQNTNTSVGDKIKPVTVAGHTGTLTETPADPKNPKLAGSCRINVVVDDQVGAARFADQPNATKNLQVVSTSGDTCELAQKAAESALATIH
jgi:hypothetical protein